MKPILQRLLIFSLLCLLFSLPFAGCLYAKTLILEGSLKSSIDVKQLTSFSVIKPVSSLTFKFFLPTAFSNGAVRQSLQTLQTIFEPQPVKVEDKVDTFGNRFKVVTWRNVNSDIRINTIFQVSIDSELPSMESRAAFPLKALSQDVLIYLKSTKNVQSDSSDISSLSKSLTANASNEYEAVTAILNFVADNIKYTYNPPQYDAHYTLRTKSGNCQNFAHFSMALLRAAGIPARIVGGISLKEQWKIPTGEGNLVQAMGQGGHAWMEIYFPDLGWLSYDPQQSKQFTSSRHIKQTHGLDASDINDSWEAIPYLPQYNEIIDAKFLDDKVSVKLKSSIGMPRPYMLSNSVLVKAAIPPLIKPPPKEEPKPPVEVTPILPKGKVIEFGNMEFPNLVDVYRVIGDKGFKILDKETAEYVTSKYIFAQAFKFDESLIIEKISLAMRKFGGDGTIYIDLVADDNGRPSLTGIRSMPIFIENIRRRPGYYWVDFVFPPEAPTKLTKGKYWIVLRFSGEVIMNWFYIPGKPYGDSNDTRSTLKGYKWEDILNYDFVFKVKARRS